MNTRLEEAKALLQRAKADYRARLRQIESQLRIVVAQSPGEIADAQAVQASYSDMSDFALAQLAPYAQPAVAETAKSTSPRAAADDEPRNDVAPAEPAAKRHVATAMKKTTAKD